MHKMMFYLPECKLIFKDLHENSYIFDVSIDLLQSE